MESQSTNPNNNNPFDKRLEGWADRSRQQHLQSFSELDVLLRALDRFFAADEIRPPAPVGTTKPATSSRNYFRELNAVKDVIFRVLSILEGIIPQGSKNAYQFMKFTETTMTSPRKRDAFRESFFKQDTKEQSLFLLYDSLAHINGVLMDVLKSKQIQHTSFVNIGELISQHIRENVFFNPFRQEIDPVLDFIENYEISAIVRSIEDKRLRKSISLVLIYLFRILRFISHTNKRLPQRTVSLHVSILILMLLRSELQHFLSYLDTADASSISPEITLLMKSVRYQYAMEMRRVYKVEMKEIFEKRTVHQLRSKIENSSGILQNLTEQCIIQIAQVWRPNLRGEHIFNNFVTKAEQSTRLREDLFVLGQVLSVVQSEDAPQARKAEARRALSEVMKYFEVNTFKLLRYDDLQDIMTFFQDLRTLSETEPEGLKLMEKCHLLAILASTTIGQVNNRAELVGRPLNLEKAQAVVRQYMPTY